MDSTEHIEGRKLCFSPRSTFTVQKPTNRHSPRQFTSVMLPQGFICFLAYTVELENFTFYNLVQQESHNRIPPNPACREDAVEQFPPKKFENTVIYCNIISISLNSESSDMCIVSGKFCELFALLTFGFIWSQVILSWPCSKRCSYRATLRAADASARRH